MYSLLAALTFFTRLPFWKIAELPKESYKRVVTFWPLTGWLTGGVMCAVFWIMAQMFNPIIAAVFAIASRLFVTGALHEDGLADFFDGMGGGTTRSRTLAIMKDSHIGTYGVIGLILYFLLATLFIADIGFINVIYVIAVLIAGDAWSKFCAGQIINFLPYARKEEEAKNKTIYNRMSMTDIIIAFITGSLPLLLLPPTLLPAAAAPVMVSGIIILYLRRRLGGYTGDCCGALFLMCELSFYITAGLLVNHSS